MNEMLTELLGVTVGAGGTHNTTNSTVNNLSAIVPSATKVENVTRTETEYLP